MKERKSKNLNCWRIIKRYVRKLIGWNDWRLRSQILVQISILSAVFFIVYFAFNLTFTSYELKSKVLTLLREHLFTIDLEKLNIDTISSTICF